MKFFGRSKNKTVYNQLEDGTQKQNEVHHEDLSLKQIDAELKQLKKRRQKLTPLHISQFAAGSFFVGVPVAILPSYFATNNINNREIMSLDRQIDQLEESRYRITHHGTSPSR
ncbi:hypothetical protein [Legionella longbeachae]|uniref:hypothetical protein n=1 Tax=Legionella longbeachae TaxID=450 RepID=UPI0012448286|nr:hypothetical protein [Legionella longbeachae]QEY52733.1 hypothetical protein FQU71_16715 [Legionella longbeachae]